MEGAVWAIPASYGVIVDVQRLLDWKRNPRKIMDDWIRKNSEGQLEEAAKPFQKPPKTFRTLAENIENPVRAMKNMTLSRFCSQRIIFKTSKAECCTGALQKAREPQEDP